MSNDPVFWKAVGNTATFAAVGTFADVAGGLILALLLYTGVPFARFYRVVWFTPVLMSYVVVGIIWVWIYDYDWGVVNLVLRAIGLGYSGAFLAGRSADSALGGAGDAPLEVARLQHDRLPRRPPCPAERRARGR